MKWTIVEEADAELQVIIRCAQADDPQVLRLRRFLEGDSLKIPVRTEQGIQLLSPEAILYCEYVDSGVFAYTIEAVFPTSMSLQELEQAFQSVGFFRCSKSMVVNLHAITSLKSEVNGRILATLQNSERILISRHYAAALRQTLLR